MTSNSASWCQPGLKRHRRFLITGSDGRWMVGTAVNDTIDTVNRNPAYSMRQIQNEKCC